MTHIIALYGVLFLPVLTDSEKHKTSPALSLAATA